MSHWSVTWTACFSAITKSRIDAIEAYVATKVDGFRPGELDQVVEQLAENWNSKEMGSSPGIGLLIKTIRGNRLRERGIDTSEPYEITQARREISRLPANTLDRWEVICKAAAIDTKWAYKLESYAAQNGGFTLPWWVAQSMHPSAKWQMPKPRGVSSWVDALRKAGEARQLTAGAANGQAGGYVYA